MKIKELVIATKNKGKIKEIREILKDLPIKILNLHDFPQDFVLLEDSTTYEENAIKKAKEVARITGKLTLADDSGVEIDALEGKPGVYSARFKSDEATDEERNEEILNLMKNLPLDKRGARYVCIVVVVSPLGEVIIKTQGECEGVINYKPKGDQGFGYDPIFFIPEYNKTMAELPLEIKNKISHRGKAVREAKKMLHLLIGA